MANLYKQNIKGKRWKSLATSVLFVNMSFWAYRASIECINAKSTIANMVGFNMLMLVVILGLFSAWTIIRAVRAHSK